MNNTRVKANAEPKPENNEANRVPSNLWTDYELNITEKK